MVETSRLKTQNLNPQNSQKHCDRIQNEKGSPKNEHKIEKRKVKNSRKTPEIAQTETFLSFSFST